ncbi:MAG: hypothetical protein P4M12_03930, partial [Gammaproteobacteria bacterium]|nr:hypothetical protein [Gammaproteobacteria bacterium]
NAGSNSSSHLVAASSSNARSATKQKSQKKRMSYKELTSSDDESEYSASSSHTKHTSKKQKTNVASSSNAYTAAAGYNSNAATNYNSSAAAPEAIIMKSRCKYVTDQKLLTLHHPDITRELNGGVATTLSQMANAKNFFFLADMVKKVQWQNPELSIEEATEVSIKRYKAYLQDHRIPGSAKFYITDTGSRMTLDLISTICKLVTNSSVTPVTRLAVECSTIKIDTLLNQFPSLELLIINKNNYSSELLQEYALARPGFRVMFGPEIGQSWKDQIEILKAAGVNCSFYQVTQTGRNNATAEEKSTQKTKGSSSSSAHLAASSSSNAKPQRKRNHSNEVSSSDDEGNESHITSHVNKSKKQKTNAGSNSSSHLVAASSSNARS